MQRIVGVSFVRSADFKGDRTRQSNFKANKIWAWWSEGGRERGREIYWRGVFANRCPRASHFVALCLPLPLPLLLYCAANLSSRATTALSHRHCIALKACHKCTGIMSLDGLTVVKVCILRQRR